MGDGLRGLYRPFQVICVLAAVLPTATIFLVFCPAERAGFRPVTNAPDPGARGERLNAGIASVPNSNIRIPLGSECQIHSTRSTIALLRKRGEANGGNEQPLCNVGA